MRSQSTGFALVLVIVLIANLAAAPRANAYPGNAKGWCTTISGGPEECGFQSAFAACKRQHQSWAPMAQFIGHAPFSSKWYLQLCRWKTGAGIPNPSIVTFKCVTFTSKPAPNGCDQPPQNKKCTNGGGSPRGETDAPIDLVSGTKRFAALDYETTDGGLRLSRSYSSLAFAGAASVLAAKPIGLANWAFDFQIELQIGEQWEGQRVVTVTFPDGISIAFARQTSGAMTPYTPTQYPLPQTDHALSFTGTWPSNLNTIRTAKTYWSFRDRDDNVWSLETFADSANGLYMTARPVSVTYRSGRQLTFAYGSVYELTSITDSHGKQITFDWDLIDPSVVGGTGAIIPGAIKQANLPGGYKVKYSYESLVTNTTGLPQPERLSKVEFVDASNVVLDSTTYEHTDANLPNGITGVLD
jgi:hypothetical protein